MRRSSRYISPALAGGVIEDYLDEIRNGGAATRALTEKEVEIVRYFANGMTLKEVSNAADMNPKTVSYHRSRIMEKIGVETTAELVKYAIREGIISLEE